MLGVGMCCGYVYWLWRLGKGKYINFINGWAGKPFNEENISLRWQPPPPRPQFAINNDGFLAPPGTTSGKQMSTEN